MTTVTTKQIAKVFTIGDVLDRMEITQKFGSTALGWYAEWGLNGHNGTDYLAVVGTKTYAPFKGRVVRQADNPSGGGLELEIESDEIVVEGVKIKLRAVYYHLKEFKVRPNAPVERGQIVALTGNTGKYTTGPHLHFGIKVLYAPNWKTDFNNGYKGAVDPTLLFDTKPWAKIVEEFIATHKNGLVKSPQTPAVFKIRNGKRYWFNNEKCFYVFYDDFSTVKTFNNELIDAVPYGGEIQLKEFI
jgi:murein DD-endopeptidase MepM/ murein hydrolase activator NlpD